MIDTRLLGTWQSDLRKTKQAAREWCDLPEAKRKKLNLIFGKLRVRFTRTRIYREFDGSNSVFESSKSVVRYQVVAKDYHSVAILAPGIFDEDEQEIYHIHFEGKYHWVWPDLPAFPEYFKRIE
ncbi:MAG: hypothetical protein JW993_04720 [Sedimentisphaerales bacterium]|nr:hypothetical protein [Sedimentisphaerales bacterium]